MKLPQLQQKLSNKEFLEKAAIVAVVVVAVSYAGWAFLISPTLDKIAQAEKDLAAKQKVYDGDKKLMGRHDRTMRDYTAAQARLLKTMEAMPPTVNPLAWANDFFRNLATQNPGIAHIRPVSISEIGTIASPVWVPGESPLFEEYQLRFELECSYHEFGAYVAAIEQYNPLIRIVSFVIDAADAKGRSRITMQLAIPRYSIESFKPSERPDAEDPKAPVPPAAVKEKAKAPEGGG